MIGRVFATRSGAALVLQATTDRLDAVTVLNLGPGVVELVDDPSKNFGEGTPLVPGGEWSDLIEGGVQLWAITESVATCELAVVRLTVEAVPTTFAFKGPVDDLANAELPYFEAQVALRGPATDAGAKLVSVEWHGEGPDGDPHKTSFAVVNEELEELQDLIGERVLFTFQGRQAYAYVLRSMALDAEISVNRRLFMALAPLSVTEILAELKLVV